MANESTRRRKSTGRSKGTFLGIPHYVFRSSEFGQLDGWSLKLLVEIAGKFNGYNNGDLSCVFSQLKLRGWRSNGTLSKARKRLLDAGWLLVSRHGGRHRCALYAVTWLPVDHCEGKGLEIKAEHSASNLWQTSKRQGAIRANVAAMRTSTATNLDKG